MDSLTVENLARATALWLAFVGGLFVLRKLVPGPMHQGQLLRDGTRKSYKLNAFYILLLFCAFLAAGQGLHTWDVIAENFGFMLVWGDAPFVPFFYSIGGWFVLRNPEPMPAYEAAALCLLFAVGLWVFRGTNQQKHQYKEDPAAPIWGRPPETVGGKLLVSGFWGIGRKLNYTGELMVYFSWTLCTGTESLVPYILPLWLVCLFSHRAWRDEQRCHKKYGALWEEYCRRARFRMIPFLY